MKQTTLDKLVHLSVARGMTPGEFARMLCSPPHNLTPPEATPLMKEYARQMAAFGPVKNSPRLKSGPHTHRVNKGENVSSTSNPTILSERRPTLPEPSGEQKADGNDCSTQRLSIINRSAVKTYALKVAKEKRPKFKRVSAEFLDGVQASLETVIRGLAKSGGDDVAPDTDADWFVNGRTVRMAEEQLNIAVRAITARRVHCQPSIGVTLK